MSPNRSAADRLNDHLDAVVNGEATRSLDLDPTMSTTVEHFFAVDDTPGPPPGLADHVWQQLMESAEVEKFGPIGTASQQNSNGRSTIRPRLTIVSSRHADPRRRGPSTLAYFATAALLVLTLLGGLVALRGSLLLIGPEQRAIILPATDRSLDRVLPSDSLAETLLIQSRLDQLPPEPVESHQIALNRIHLAPGAVEPAGSQADTGVGVELFTVESGQVTVEADAPVLVTRAVAYAAVAPSRVEPGTAIMLDVGDQLAAPSGVTFRRRNEGSSPATLLSFSIGTGRESGATTPLPAGVTYDSGLPSKQPPTFPALPAEAIVLRRTLPPGTEVAIRDVPGLQLVYVESGDLGLLYSEAETSATPEQAVIVRAGSGTESFGPTPQRAVLANRGADPLVILTASVDSTSAGEPTPPAPSSNGWGTGDYTP